jgi:ERCC4-type nuclease
MLLVSPTDRDLLTLLGDVAMSHSLPEQHGADVLIVAAEQGKMAIQRKAFPDDLLASLDDGRLARELALLSRTECPVLIVEGRPHWTADGHLMASWASRWTRQQLRNLIRSVWLTHGVMVEYTDDINDTADSVVELDKWFRKKVHRSLLTRPKQAARDSWGTSSLEDVMKFLLQGFPGIGTVLADAILERFRRVPLSWNCTLDELKSVPGIGNRRAKELWELLQ